MLKHPRHPKNGLPPRGFSLIELLVTLAVVSILSAILMPAFANVRTLALRLMCQNNMRAIHVGLMSYASEYRGENLPDSAYTDNRRPQQLMALSFTDTNGDASWDGLGKLGMGSRRYLDDKRSYFCPAHNALHTIDNQTAQFDPSIELPLPGETVYGNYHYWADWNQRVLAQQSARSRSPEILVTDGMRTRQDVNHRFGVNALRGDGSVTWLGDANLLAKLKDLPADDHEMAPRRQLELFNSIVSAMGSSAR